MESDVILSRAVGNLASKAQPSPALTQRPGPQSLGDIV